MRVKLIAVGRTTDAAVSGGIALYRERIGHYLPFEWVEIPALKGGAALKPAQIKEREGAQILKMLTPKERVVLLDEKGKLFTSSQWARHLEKTLAQGYQGLTFIIGGSYGFDQAIYDRADEMLSLSPMTFPHQMVRLFFAEQLYRSCTIMKGESYHHE